jgi:two-component system, LytTR family, response regulator
MNLKIVIVEDDKIVRRELHRLLSSETEVEIVDECADGQSAIDSVEQHDPDLLMLDVGLPGMDGFGVLKSLRGRRLPLIALITGYDEHAIKAFEMGAIDYLLKPSSPRRIRAMLQRARIYATLLREAPGEFETLPSRNTRFRVRSGQRTSFIAPEQIDWIEASGNYVILHVGKQNHFLREAITKLGEKLLKRDFVRVSRSAMVRIDRVKGIRTSRGGHHWIVLDDGQCVPITRGIREMEARLSGS